MTPGKAESHECNAYDHRDSYYYFLCLTAADTTMLDVTTNQSTCCQLQQLPATFPVCLLYSAMFGESAGISMAECVWSR